MEHNPTKTKLLRHGLWLLLLLSALPVWAQRDPDQIRRSKQQNEANERIRQGDIRGAIEQLQALVEAGPSDIGPSLQLLDLQVRLQDEAGARSTIDGLLRRLPASGPLVDFQQMQIAGQLAPGLLALGQENEAEALWKRMRDSKLPPHLALLLFNSYRQAARFDECLNLVSEQRRASGDPALWALNLAILHQERGDCRAAFGELANWQREHRGGGGSLVSRQLLALVEACADADFENWMAEEAEEFGPADAEMGEAVLDALVQRGRADRATPLAWSLDRDGSGRVPYGLARSLLQDDRFAAAAPLLEELERRGSPVAEQAEFRLLSARCKSGLGLSEEALADYRRLESKGPLAGEARLEAARLLHRPLDRPQEAADELEPLLRQAPAHGQALPLAVLLRGALGQQDEARALLDNARRASRHGEPQPQLDFLEVRLDWWAGRLTPAAEGLGRFVERQVRHDSFNDAIELLDLLANASSDSLAVVAAGEADRLSFLGRSAQALALLDRSARAAGPAAEALDWMAARLAVAELPPVQAREVLAGFRRRHRDSIRLDRIAWMEFGEMERQGLPSDSLRAAGLALLEAWPNSLLQDTVRRRLRELMAERTDP